MNLVSLIQAVSYFILVYLLCVNKRTIIFFSLQVTIIRGVESQAEPVITVYTPPVITTLK